MPDANSSGLLTSQLSRNAQTQQEMDQQDQQASMYRGSGAYGGAGYGPMGGFDPSAEGGYNPEMAPGYAPHAPSGFAPFLSHLHEQGKMRTGMYTQDVTLPDGQVISSKGKNQGELQDLGHDAYLKLAPEGRAYWIQRENNQDLGDAATAKLGQSGDAPFNPGSINDDVLGNRSPSYQAPAAQPAMMTAMMTASTAANGGWTSPTYAPRQMGDPNDTAKYGPRMTNPAPPAMPSPNAGMSPDPYLAGTGLDFQGAGVNINRPNVAAPVYKDPALYRPSAAQSAPARPQYTGPVPMPATPMASVR